TPSLQEKNMAVEHDNDDAEDNEKHGLPSFPDSPMQRGFSQSAIKDAITHESTEDTLVGQPLQTANSAIKTVEVDEWSPQQPIPSPPVIRKISEIPPQIRQEFSPVADTQSFSIPSVSPVLARTARASKNSDIFIKIDKFYSAKKALEATSHKLEEIDAVLHKIRETKMREEQELTTWEKDLATIKTRIKEVTETIFEKIE
ncbi:MAG TPA: hypothetical protein VJH37_00355, partial [Candidatus Nanoarchaeia archaeon]|nr:hypothetical protein [Candidatus Nanoarchaeia archaeon]